MFRYQFFILLLLTLTISALTACQQTKPPFKCTDSIGCITIAPTDPVKLGVIHSLSGGTANIGNTQVQSIKLALNNRDNQVLNHPVSLQIEDELCTAEGGANAALRIVADPQITAILGTSCSGAAATAGQIISKAGLVMISGSNSAPSLTTVGGNQGDDWQPGYFRTRPNDALLIQTAAEFAFNELGVTTAATINDGDTYTQGVTDIFEHTFSKLGGQIVASTSVNKGDTNMKPILTHIANSKAEFVFFPLFSPEADLLIQQSKDVPGLENTLFLGTINSLNLDTFTNTVGENGVGTYLISTVPPEGPANDKLLEQYQKTFDQPPQHPAYPYAYDATNLLLDALVKVAHDEDGTLHIGKQALREALYKTSKFKGVSGPVTCNNYGDCGSAIFNILRLDDRSGGIEGLQENIIHTYTPE